MLKKSIFSILLVAATLILFACTSVNYNGPTYKPTKKVKIFYSKERIKKPYKVMGKATASTWYSYQNRSLRPALVEKAKECGADAILIHSISESISAPARVSDNTVDNALQVQDDEGVVSIANEVETSGPEEQTTESVDRANILAHFLKYTDKK